MEELTVSSSVIWTMKAVRMRKLSFLLSSFGCTQERNLKDIPLTASDFLSLVGGSEIDTRGEESIPRIFAKCLADENFRATLIVKICNVIEEVTCIVRKRVCVSSKVKEESFRNVNEVKRKGNGLVCPASINSGLWQCIQSQSDNIGEIFRQVEWTDNPDDLNGKWSKLYAVFIPLVEPKVKEFELEEEIRTQAFLDFQNDGSAVQSRKYLNRRDRIQVLSKVCEVEFFRETTGVLKVSESSTSKTECVQHPEHCISMVSVVHPGNNSGV